MNNCALAREEVEACFRDPILDFFTDAVELYKACVAATNTSNNEYLHLVYNHQDSLPLLRLCRTMVITYKVEEDSLNGMLAP